MIIYLALSTTAKLNYLPHKNGLSMYYSPQMLLHCRHLDFNKQCKHSLGVYVQAHDEPAPSNTIQVRTVNCIYLHHTILTYTAVGSVKYGQLIAK